jgi:SHAQKYF class myb-like DNA-binding protein
MSKKEDGIKLKNLRIFLNKIEKEHKLDIKTADFNQKKNENKPIFGLIVDYSLENSNSSTKQTNEIKVSKKKQKKEGGFNNGRWTHEEHERFIEALLKYGNDWRNVQKHVYSRTSTQARSHAQKFFFKISQTKIEEYDLDFSQSNIKNINCIVAKLNKDQLKKTIGILKEVSFHRRSSLSKSNGEEEASSLFEDLLKDGKNKEKTVSKFTPYTKGFQKNYNMITDLIKEENQTRNLSEIKTDELLSKKRRRISIVKSEHDKFITIDYYVNDIFPVSRKGSLDICDINKYNNNSALNLTLQKLKDRKNSIDHYFTPNFFGSDNINYEHRNSAFVNGTTCKFFIDKR